MIRGRCPICSGPYEVPRLKDLPSFPFCSERCRLIDLGRWADGKYVIPGGPAQTPHEPAREEADESE
jgi:endogenous inhibitor of DNA gyrase (YacG/DUF329 family)